MVQVLSKSQMADAAEMLARQAADDQAKSAISTAEIAALNEKFEAFFANVVVKMIQPTEEISIAGVVKVVPMRRSQEAIVVLAGPGEYRNGAWTEMPIEPGDHILVTKAGGDDIELDGLELKQFHITQVKLKRRTAVPEIK